MAILEEITEARRVFREIKILRSLNHVNVLSIKEIVAPTTFEHFQVCVQGQRLNLGPVLGARSRSGVQKVTVEGVAWRQSTVVCARRSQ